MTSVNIPFTLDLSSFKLNNKCEKENPTEIEDRINTYKKLSQIKFNILNQMSCLQYIQHIDIAKELEEDILKYLCDIWELLHSQEPASELKK